jgi:hypothetical protein
MVFSQGKLGFLYLLEWSYFAQRWCSSHMESLRGRQYSFQMLNQFPQGNFVLDPPASNIDGFPTRETVLLPFKWMELFCTKAMFLTHGKFWQVGSIPFKSLLNSHRETICKTLLPLSQIVLFHKVHVSPFHLKSVFYLKWMILPLQNDYRSQVYLSQPNSVLTGKGWDRTSCL